MDLKERKNIKERKKQRTIYDEVRKVWRKNYNGNAMDKKKEKQVNPDMFFVRQAKLEP